MEQRRDWPCRSWPGKGLWNTQIRCDSALGIQDISYLESFSQVDFASFWGNSDTADFECKWKWNGICESNWNGCFIDFIIAGVCGSETVEWGLWNMTFRIWQLWGSNSNSLSSICTTPLSLSPLNYKRKLVIVRTPCGSREGQIELPSVPGPE